jgi:hypothetical protein
VRWQQLFDDLDAQARALGGAEHDAEVHDRAVLARGTVGLLSRLARATAVDLVLRDGAAARGTVVEHGRDWVVLHDGGAGAVLVPAHAIVRARCGSPDRAATATDAGLRTVLRGLVRRRCYVRASLRSVGVLGGTLDAVGADHVELALHDADVPRRQERVRAVELVALRALCRVSYEER